MPVLGRRSRCPHPGSEPCRQGRASPLTAEPGRTEAPPPCLCPGRQLRSPRPRRTVQFPGLPGEGARLQRALPSQKRDHDHLHPRAEYFSAGRFDLGDLGRDAPQPGPPARGTAALGARAGAGETTHRTREDARRTSRQRISGRLHAGHKAAHRRGGAPLQRRVPQPAGSDRRRALVAPLHRQVLPAETGAHARPRRVP